MLSFELNCSKAQATKIIRRLNFVTSAVSLGGVESLICFPSDTSHRCMSLSERKKLGISDTLLRLSIGIEDTEDLLEDFSQALKKNPC